MVALGHAAPSCLTLWRRGADSRGLAYRIPPRLSERRGGLPARGRKRCTRMRGRLTHLTLPDRRVIFCFFSARWRYGRSLEPVRNFFFSGRRTTEQAAPRTPAAAVGSARRCQGVPKFGRAVRFHGRELSTAFSPSCFDCTSSSVRHERCLGRDMVIRFRWLEPSRRTYEKSRHAISGAVSAGPCRAVPRRRDPLESLPAAARASSGAFRTTSTHSFVFPVEPLSSARNRPEGRTSSRSSGFLAYINGTIAGGSVHSRLGAGRFWGAA